MSFGGKEITYDASGNPTGYRGATLAYEGGRRLKSYKKATDANAYEFTFDEDNLRLTKKHKEASGYDKTWTYWHTDGKLWGERITEKVQVGNFGILFWQDKVTEISYAHLSTGLAGFTVKEQIGTAAATTKSYLYRKNALGDIDAIYDTDMNLVGEYVYDAWGNCTIETTGTDNYAIMQLNPFRYRGYYWDKELNLYYLQTRYYDPETGRFINADNIGYGIVRFKTLNSLNLFSYCLNNPINKTDPTGEDWKSFWKKVGNFFDKVGQTLDAIIMTFSIEGGVGMGFGIEGKAGLLSFYFGGHGNLFYFKAGGDEDYPLAWKEKLDLVLV